MRHRSCLTLILTMALLMIPLGAGADIYDPGQNPMRQFGMAIDSDKLFETPFIKTTHAQITTLFNKNRPLDKRVQVGTLALEKIQALIKPGFSQGETPLELEIFQSLETIIFYYKGLAPEVDTIYPESWRVDRVKFTLPPSKSRPEIDFKSTYIHGNDPDRFRAAIDALGVVNLIHKSLSYIRRDASLAKLEGVVLERGKEWNAYFNKGVAQWPWEMMANGWCYRKKISGKKGLLQPPESQLICLHPEVAMEYVDGAEDGSELEPALMLEVLGINAWSWEKNGAQKGPMGLCLPVGVSLVVSYSDRNGTDDVGIGGLLRINHVYTLGVTSHGDDIGLFISLNAAKLFTSGRDKLESYLEYFNP